MSSEDKQPCKVVETSKRNPKHRNLRDQCSIFRLGDGYINYDLLGSMKNHDPVSCVSYDTEYMKNMISLTYQSEGERRILSQIKKSIFSMIHKAKLKAFKKAKFESIKQIPQKYQEAIILHEVNGDKKWVLS